MKKMQVNSPEYRALVSGLLGREVKFGDVPQIPVSPQIERENLFVGPLRRVTNFGGPGNPWYAPNIWMYKDDEGNELNIYADEDKKKGKWIFSNLYYQTPVNKSFRTGLKLDRKKVLHLFNSKTDTDDPVTNPAKLKLAMEHWNRKRKSYWFENGQVKQSALAPFLAIIKEETSKTGLDWNQIQM